MKKNKKRLHHHTKKTILVSDKLKDFDVFIDPFGKINAVYDVDVINQYLNDTIKDRKIKE